MIQDKDLFIKHIESIGFIQEGEFYTKSSANDELVDGNSLFTLRIFKPHNSLWIIIKSDYPYYEDSNQFVYRGRIQNLEFFNNLCTSLNIL